MKHHSISLGLAAAIAALGAGCSSTASSTDSYSQYPASTTTYPAYPATQTNDPNQTARGAVAGAAAGAVIGGIVGNNSSHGNTEKGAAIGAVAGGLTGAAIGRRADQREASARVAESGYTVQEVPLAPVSEPQEIPPTQPSPNAVWIRGSYEYTGSGYQWQAGRWEVPPAGARAWVTSSWQPAANGGYVFVRGHWQ